MAEQTTYKFQHIPAYSWWVLVASFLCFMCFFLAMNATSVFGTLIQDEFQINASMLSLLTTATMLTFCLFPVLAGPFFQRFGVTRMVPVALCLNILSGVLLFIPFFSSTYEGYMITRFICGLTGCLNGPIAAHLCLWFPKHRRGFVTGILMGFIGVGFSVTAAIGPVLLNMGMSWQMAVATLTIIPSAIMAVVFRFGVKEFNKIYPDVESMADLMPPVDESRKSTRFDNEPKVTSVKEMWRSKRCWCAALMAGCFCLPLYGLPYTLPLFYENDLGLGFAVASGIVAATFVWKVLAAPVGGGISDIIFKSERYQICIISAVLCSIFLFVLIFVSSGASVTVLTVVTVLAFFSASLYGGTIWPQPWELADKKTAFAVSGFIVSIPNVFSVLVTPICGMLLDVTGTGIAPLIFIAVGVLLAIPFAKGMHM